MKLVPEKVESLIAQIDELISSAKEDELLHSETLGQVHDAYRKSAVNLIHYRALRNRDIRDLQRKLGNIGLSRLSGIESHVMASLLASRSILGSFIDPIVVDQKKEAVSFKKGSKLIRAHSKALLGYRSKGRRVRIMVTLPSEAAQQPELVDDFVVAGMNSARINCAHDDPEAWEAMISHVRAAAKKHRRKVKVCMDLAGPKIRTGNMRPGPRVLTFVPQRDSLGRIVAPASVLLAPHGSIAVDETSHHIPVPAEWLRDTKTGDEINFIDTRGKERSLTVVEKTENGCLAHGYQRAWVQPGTLLSLKKDDSVAVPVGELPPKEEKIVLNVGDTFILHRDPRAGEPAEYDDDGNQLTPAHISCTSPEIFSQVEQGERILLDDGKIEGYVLNIVSGEQMLVGITYAKESGQKLAADKGINFPDSDLQIRGLTAKDREDLKFIAEHADVVNLSFVNSVTDVQDLVEALRELDALDRLGIILKIETQSGYNNLTEILLAAMQTYPVGVMIARGDLAVETGWEYMPLIQQEILSLSLAAHVPDVWATQVLENLAKKGLPSRAELTDAAMSQHAECVMLNKGPHILQAIRMLDHILKHMMEYRDKELSMLPALETACR